MRSHATEQIQAQIDPAAQRDFQGEAEDEQEQHVAQQVVEAAVQEHGTEQTLNAETRRNEAEAEGAELVTQRLGPVTSLLPGGVGLVLRALVQALLELQVVQYRGRQILAAHAVDVFALAFLEPVAADQVVDEQRALAAQQATVEVGLHGLLATLFVTALVAEVDQGVEQDQQQGDDGGTLPVQRMLGGNDQHQPPRLLSTRTSRSPSNCRKYSMPLSRL